jgi:hypothetical protein
MSPTATTASPVASRDITAVGTTKGSALVIGSLTTAQDGKYQALISQLETTRHVDRLLVDRLVDGGMWDVIRRARRLLNITRLTQLGLWIIPPTPPCMSPLAPQIMKL